MIRTGSWLPLLSLDDQGEVFYELWCGKSDGLIFSCNDTLDEEKDVDEKLSDIAEDGLFSTEGHEEAADEEEQSSSIDNLLMYIIIVACAFYQIIYNITKIT